MASTLDAMVIGAGYAGLAMSRCLTERKVRHVVLERGRIAERWRSERWDSLRLLTPNWHTRLPHWRYTGEDPDGFMPVKDFIVFLEAYATSFDAPIHTDMTVTEVHRHREGFEVRAHERQWLTRTLIIATGHCDVSFIPAMAAGLSCRIKQMTPSQYRNPHQLTEGGVLVVGAGASGAQIAEELADAGRQVVLSVGRHRRRPRRYRGYDILWWVDQMGMFDQLTDQQPERKTPAPQLVGSDEHRSLDLGLLQQRGVSLAGRVGEISGETIYFSDDLADSVAWAEDEMHQILDGIDHYAETRGLGAPEERPKPIDFRSPPQRVDLHQAQINTLIWATGYRRSYPWLKINLVDEDGELRHHYGITQEPGLYVVGLRRQRKNKSNFVDGVGDDATFLADHLCNFLAPA